MSGLIGDSMDLKSALELITAVLGLAAAILAMKQGVLKRATPWVAPCCLGGAVLVSVLSRTPSLPGVNSVTQLKYYLGSYTPAVLELVNPVLRGSSVVAIVLLALLLLGSRLHWKIDIFAMNGVQLWLNYVPQVCLVYFGFLVLHSTDLNEAFDLLGEQGLLIEPPVVMSMAAYILVLSVGLSQRLSGQQNEV